LRSKTVINNNNNDKNITDKINTFSYLGSYNSYKNEKDIRANKSKFLQITGIFNGT
jgi:hypothetical protein